MPHTQTLISLRNYGYQTLSNEEFSAMINSATSTQIKHGDGIRRAIINDKKYQIDVQWQYIHSHSKQHTEEFNTGFVKLFNNWLQHYTPIKPTAIISLIVKYLFDKQAYKPKYFVLEDRDHCLDANFEIYQYFNINFHVFPYKDDKLQLSSFYGAFFDKKPRDYINEFYQREIKNHQKEENDATTTELSLTNSTFLTQKL